MAAWNDSERNGYRNMIYRQDTIAAIATAPGNGGIGIIRISGQEAEKILMKVFRAKGYDRQVPESHRIKIILDYNFTKNSTIIKNNRF